MTQALQRTFVAAAVTALVAGALLAGCEKKTMTTDTAAGTSTTTTVTPSPTVTEAVGKAGAATSEAMNKAGDVVADAAVTTKVKAALLADPDVKGLQIDVDTHGGAVTLTGSSNKQVNLDRAVTVAKGVDGVKSVDSRLTVQ